MLFMGQSPTCSGLAIRLGSREGQKVRLSAGFKEAGRQGKETTILSIRDSTGVFHPTPVASDRLCHRRGLLLRDG